MVAPVIEYCCTIACAERGAEPEEVHHTHVVCEDIQMAYVLAVEDALKSNVPLHGTAAVFIEAVVPITPKAMQMYEATRRTQHPAKVPTHQAPPQAH